MKPFSRLNMKTKCRISVEVMDIMQPNYYQHCKSESVQCLSAPVPCSSAFVITGGVALPLLYLFIFITAFSYTMSNEPSAMSNNQPAMSDEPPATSNEPSATCNEPSATSNNQSATSNEPPATSYLLLTINY